MRAFARLPVPIRRAAYKLGYLLLRVWWFFRRPSLTGVKCVLTNGDEVLLVRHTYGRPEWEFPGGGVKADEAPVDAARREIEEELGVTIDNWRSLGAISGRIQHRRDTLHCFQAELGRQHLELDLGELSDAAWFPRGELPRDVGKYVRRILARAG